MFKLSIILTLFCSLAIPSALLNAQGLELGGVQKKMLQQILTDDDLGGEGVDPTSIRSQDAGTPRINGNIGPKFDDATEREPVRVVVPEGGKRGNSEFQRLVEHSLGKKLEIFGHSYFAKPELFVKGLGGPQDGILEQSGTYIIKPGDQIYVRAWGQLDVDFSGYVDSNGTLFVPDFGEINVAGLKYQDLQSYLKARFSKRHKDFNLNVVLGKTRPMNVFVMGHAVKPGAYQVRSRATLLSVLFLAGGPKLSGSLRNIELRRGDQTIAKIDCYDFFVKGTLVADISLTQNDVIFIPPVGPLVAVAGSVRVPNIYEIRKDLSLNELFELSGGLSSTASKKDISLERISSTGERVIHNVDVKGKGLETEIKDGDLVYVRAISPRILNSVTLTGNVSETIQTPWRHNLKVSDLIPDPSILVLNEYWIKRNQNDRHKNWLRKKIPDKKSKDLEQAYGEEGSDLPAQLTDSVQGDNSTGAQLVRSGNEPDSGLDPLLSEITGSDGRQDMFKSFQETFVGAQVNWEYAVIKRLNVATLETKVIPFNLKRAVLEMDPSHDLLLEPGDVVTIFSADDLALPQSKRSRYVMLEGEFVSPGVYQIKHGETLRDLVIRVGGFSSNAYYYGALFTRESTRKKQQEQLERTLSRLEQEVERNAAVQAGTVLSVEDSSAVKQQATAQRALVKRLRQIKATGRIVLDANNGGAEYGLPDLPLENGDIFSVPPRPGVVSVYGSVFNQNSFLFRERYKAAQYISLAGGPTKNADAESLYILKANGIVISARQAKKGLFRKGLMSYPLMPGDAIVVPEDLHQFSVSRELKDWAQIFYQLSLGVAGLKVLSDL